MPLRLIYNKKLHGVTLKSGNFYKFSYQAFENDPTPTIIFLYAIEGINPSTNHQWRLIQAINLSYIPRNIRKQFVELWMVELNKRKNVKFTWEMVKAQYPMIQLGIRRYFLKPTYYITNLKEIPREKIMDNVVGSFIKDFSRQAKKKWFSTIKRMAKKFF